MAGFITPIGTLLTYGNTLFEAKRNKFNPSADAKFEGHLIINKAAQNTPEFKALKAEIMRVATDEFGSKMKDPAFLQRLKNPIKPYAKGEPGDVEITAKTKSAPDIVSASLQQITVSGDVWSGQLARFEVGVGPYDISGSVGVTLYLNNVQITKANMPRLDGRQSADKVFGKLEDEAGDSNAGDADEDLPF